MNRLYESKEIIRIKYVDYWKNFQCNSFTLHQILAENYNIEMVDSEPDYVMCGPFGYEFLNYSCPRIFYTGECICPDFNLYDYALGFNEISFGDRYMRFPFWLAFLLHVKKAMKKHLLTDAEILAKNKFCNFIVSNGNADESRENFYWLLNKYKRVDSGGRYINNIGKICENKYEFQKQYKFSLAFENSKYDGYITEKIIDAFAAGTIPIYWGAEDIIKEFNPKAFINCNDYASFSEVVDIIKEIDNNSELFLDMIHEPIFTEKSRGYIQYIKDNYRNVINFFDNIFLKKGEIRRNTSTVYGKKHERNCLILNIRWVCPKHILTGKRRIILVGAGGVGKDYKIQLERWSDIEIVAWADNTLKGSNGIISIENAISLEYDGVLLGVKSIAAVADITVQLIELGVNENKILWSEPWVL